MSRSLDRERMLDLLHHRRNERYLLAVANTVERLLFRSCFSELDIEGLQEVKDRSERGQTLIFVPNHQSEYDWLVLQTFLAKWQVRTAIQAGDNLFVGPLDPFLRRCSAFLAIRDQRAFYARHWLAGSLLKLLGRSPVIITRDQYNSLYTDQLKRVLADDKLHLMIFPGYETDEFSGEVKYGRSYSGRLNPLSPFVFLALRSALRDLQITNAVYVPVNISYERVPEDIVFREYKTKVRKSKIAKYVYDHYYTFLKVPVSWRIRDKMIRACVKFGEGIPADSDLKARDMAHLVWERLGRLMRVYDGNLVFSSLGNRFRVPRTEVSDALARNLELLQAAGLDTEPVAPGGNLKDTSEMLARTAKVFNFPKIPIIATHSYTTIEYDENEIFVHHPHIASYYSNKLDHILRAGAPPAEGP